jgi:putative MATE family efflux protein
MNAGPEVIRAGAVYSRILLSFDVCIVMLILINGIFRGAGDAAIAMRTLWLANGINLVLDPCFIYGIGPFPRMGVTGAAVATTIGRGIGVIYGASVLLRGKGRVAVAARHLCVDWLVLRRLIRLSGAAMVQYLISTASWLSLARINAAFGSSAVAGYTIGIRMITFAILPSWGISSAAATLVGQNLGAKRPDRAERAVWLAGGYNMAFLTLVGIVFLLFARPIVGQFTTDPAVVAFGVATLQFVSLGYPFYAWGMVMEQAFNGAGDTVTPTWINLGCYWAFQFPLTMLLAFRAGLGPRGVYLGICLAETLLAAVSVIWFRRGRWKTVQL